MAVVVPVSGADLFFFSDPYCTCVNGREGGGSFHRTNMYRLHVYRKECEGECTMWGWVYHVGVGVPCGDECTIWGWVYHVGVSVPCGGECTMWG